MFFSVIEVLSSIEKKKTNIEKNPILITEVS